MLGEAGDFTAQCLVLPTPISRIGCLRRHHQDEDGHKADDDDLISHWNSPRFVS